MKDTTLKFLTSIDVNPATMECRVDNINIIVEYDEDSTESSYLDNDYYQLTNDWLIHINDFSRPLKSILFDFYHEVGHILINLDRLSTASPSIWLDKSELKVNDRKYIIPEMACDGYAIQKLEYKGELKKYLPLTNIKKAREKNPDAELSKIKEFVMEINNDIKVRKKYLEYLISENIPEKSPKKDKTKRTPVSQKLPDDKPGKYMPAFKRWSIVKELAESAGIDTRDPYDKARSTPVPEMCFIMKNMHLITNITDDFHMRCKKIISAITSPTIKTSDWDFASSKFVKVAKPDDWEVNYTSYYYYNNITKEYLPCDIVIAQSPNIPVIFRKERINKIAEINKIQNKYRELVIKFMIPYYRRYADAVSTNKRAEISYVIEHVLKEFINGSILTVPNESYINNIISKYNKTDVIEKDIKKQTAGMLSYNDRVRIAKDKNPKKDEESDTEYTERIRHIVDATMNEERTKSKKI